MRSLLPLAIATAGGCIPHLESSGGGTDTPTATCDWEPPADNAWLDSDAGPPDDLCGEGFDEGQVVPDIRLGDQNDDTVSTWQFYGDVVVLDVSTMWCGPCKELGALTEATWQDRQSRGFMYVTVLQQNADFLPPSTADLGDWAQVFGITTPVLGDGGDSPMTSGALEAPNAFPGVLVIGRDMRVAIQLPPPYEASVLEEAIDQALEAPQPGT